MDDEKVTYKAYEMCVKHGIKNVCVHKGLFPRATAERWPHLLNTRWSTTSAKPRRTGRSSTS